MTDLMLQGIMSVFEPGTLFVIAVGLIVGVIFGSIPGISVVMAIALFLPLTFGLTPVAALSMLCAVYIGGISGGLITAILINIPGSSSNIATCFDGYPLAVKGEAGKALGVGIVFSFLGGMLSLAVLAAIAPSIARVAVQLGPAEYCVIALFSLTMVSGLSGDSLVKGLLTCTLGISISFIGMAPVSASTRYTFGLTQIRGGLDTLTLLIGIFAVAQVLQEAEKRFFLPDDYIPEKPKEYSIKGFGFSFAEFKSQLGNFFIASLIGVGIGILPGIGSNVSSIFAYGVIQKKSKYPEKFGTGIIDGVVASETTNSAATGGALVPLMSLGIPGDAATAVILSGFIIHGIQPGPLLFVNQTKLVYGIFAAIFLANIFLLASMFWGLRLYVKILSVPSGILLPVVLVFCVIGAFGLNNRVFDVIAIVFVGLLGYFLTKIRMPMTPLILGYILGPIVELNMLRALDQSKGDFSIFVSSSYGIVFVTLTVLIIIFTSIDQVKKARKAKKAT